ncbi:MAG: phosphoribosylformylglycinamidine synthase I, partial [Dehalococcoidia bacterium]|nr:phosphoribosylformylglycinamidine synthase I [Dehalococcoidia bacterium]
MRFGIVVFPGTWSDGDCYHSVNTILSQEAQFIWHKDTDLSGIDCVIIPGGFSYGDHLRAGAIAAFSPIMKAVTQFATHGGLVIGICNGFQILCESGLLPGILRRNRTLQFRCRWVNLKTNNSKTPFTVSIPQKHTLRIPISHGEGAYYADETIIKGLHDNNQIVFQYCDTTGLVTDENNPNGSIENIAGIVNKDGNVLGMMPHP